MGASRRRSRSTSQARSDGFGDELIELAGYELLYLTDDAGASTPFGMAGLTAGWHMLHRVQLTCADRIDLGNGTFSWRWKYEELPLDAVMTVIPGFDPWDPPHNCP